MSNKENRGCSVDQESQKRISFKKNIHPFEKRIAKIKTEETIRQQDKPIPSNEEIQQTPEEKQRKSNEEAAKDPIFIRMRKFVESSEFQEALLAYFEAFSSDMINRPKFKPKINDDQNASKKYPFGTISINLPLGDELINNELRPTVPHELIILISYGSLYGLGNKLKNKFIIYYNSQYNSQEFSSFKSLLNQMAKDVYNKRKDLQLNNQLINTFTANLILDNR